MGSSAVKIVSNRRGTVKLKGPHFEPLNRTAFSDIRCLASPYPLLPLFKVVGIIVQFNTTSSRDQALLGA